MGTVEIPTDKAFCELNSYAHSLTNRDILKNAKTAPLTKQKQ